jgi:hypothetical protein
MLARHLFLKPDTPPFKPKAQANPLLGDFRF